MLTLRVLVDSSVVEAFAQGGRATTAGLVFSRGNQTALVWQQSKGETQPAGRPVFSVKIWEMSSAWI